MIIKTLIAGTLGTLGFSLLFKIDIKRLLPATLCGLLSCGIYLYLDIEGASLFLSNFTAMAVAALVSEILARILRAPAAVFSLSSTIPLIPGGKLYYTMSGFIFGNYSEALKYGKETLAIGLGIAGGMIAASVIWALVINTLNKKKNNQRRSV